MAGKAFGLQAPDWKFLLANALPATIHDEGRSRGLRSDMINCISADA